jgi:hydrogenase-4 membrane subunit HyfE
MKQRILAVMAYVLPTFPLGYFWHLTVFADYYKSLAVYREDIVIPLGITSMVIQGIIWAILYERMFAGESIVRGALKFACLAAPLAWSFLVVAVSAKHHMRSVGGYMAIESAFIATHYLIVSPLIAAVYAKSSRNTLPE